jgi:hypothetical protein
LYNVVGTSQHLDIVVVKITNHVKCPPKEKHVQNEYSDLIMVVDPYEIYVEVVLISPIGAIM